MTAAIGEDMSVERTHTGHETRYELRDGAALVCVLIFGQPEIEQAAWKILLPGPAGTEDLYASERFLTPDARQLQTWLTPSWAPGPLPSSPTPWMHSRR
jgi:hypothetical protein